MKLNIIIFYLSLVFLFVLPLHVWGDPFTGPLTDEQINLRDNYIHKGYMQRTKDELCKNDKSICLGIEQSATGSKMPDALIEGVAKMYGMFFGLGGDLNYKNKKGEKVEQRDFCAFIPMAIETVALTTQTVGQQSITTQPIDPEQNQIDSLRKIAKSHSLRKRTAAIQMGGWASTCACYIAVALTQGIGFADVGKSFVLSRVGKIGASCGLMSYYTVKFKKSGDAAAKVNKIAEELERKTGKGKCDPILHSLCYCAQPETQYDIKYCVPEEFRDRKDDPASLISCVNSNLKADPQCLCKASNSCYDTTTAAFASDFGLGGIAVKQAVGSANPLLRGNLQLAATESFARTQLGASSKFFKENDTLNPQSVTLNKNEKLQARALEGLGLTPGISAHFASSKLSGNGLKFLSNQKNENSALSTPGVNDSLEGNFEPRKKSGEEHVLYFDSPTNSGHKTNGYDQDSQFNAELLKQMQQKKKIEASEGGDKVLTFAEEAERKAQISGNSSRSLFEIISYRYRQSTWSKFDVFKNPSSPSPSPASLAP